MTNQATGVRRRSSQRGFTLIELLAVIVIIGLLISILVPAVSAVRNSAKNTVARSTLTTLATALETFKADARLGGAYPPSASDRGGGGTGTPPMVRNPFTRLPNANTQRDIRISGAGLLVWSLAGADLLGTPGFKVFRTSGTPSRYWAEDTDAEFNTADDCGAYALYPSSAGTQLEGQPARPRAKPYVDLEKSKVTRWNQTAQSFAIEAETKVLGNNAPKRNYPMFLDSFGFPILYYRADPSGTVMADKEPSPRTKRGRYHWTDNEILITGTDQLKLLPDAQNPGFKHKLDWGTAAELPTGAGPLNATQHEFARFIQNDDVQASRAARNGDSFLLISPGADGVYGSSDDITNFEHNGR